MQQATNNVFTPSASVICGRAWGLCFFYLFLELENYSKKNTWFVSRSRRLSRTTILDSCPKSKKETRHCLNQSANVHDFGKFANSAKFGNL